MPNIRFMYPLIFWVGVPLALAFFALAGYYSTRLNEGLRRFYAPAGMFLLDKCSPRNLKEMVAVWALWALATVFFVTAMAMPNGSFAPDLVAKGAAQVEFVIQVNNAFGDESDRKFHPDGDPGTMYQYGTRLDMVKRFIDNDFLPQLKNNETGITNVEGKGYNFWDLTTDNGNPISAFRVMLDNFEQVGAAPGAGADYASGIETALAEFDLITEQDRKAGDTTAKERFIVLFADGNYSGDPKALQKAEQDLVKRKIHLLIVGMGEPQNGSVPKYDPITHQRDGVFDGQTQLKPAVLESIQKAVPGSDLIYAPAGTEHISYNFPSKAGNLYAMPGNSNLCAWFVAAGLVVILIVTFARGRILPRHLLQRALRLAGLARSSGGPASSDAPGGRPGSSNASLPRRVSRRLLGGFFPTTRQDAGHSNLNRGNK